jgi:formamidopyrimidine-DNA glycosylase
MHFTAGDPKRHRLLAWLAAEPLSPAFSAEAHHARARGRRVSIKQFLMDARHVVGVGNIYASEVLFRARVDPRRAAGRLSPARFKRIVAAIRAVLKDAIDKGGTTLRDYVNAEGLPGSFSPHLDVYERAGLPCRRCGTRLKQIVQGGRSSYYCPTCQT